ncbi:beta-lactamase/transpeptidase-like protein [Hymenopellis radicata]|nr:beta-lactamase/transpeptidase-like protein [Hymenopellis radicata]
MTHLHPARHVFFDVLRRRSRAIRTHGGWLPQRHARHDHGKNGTLTATVPYFQRPGEESIWAGAGGVLSSARDLATWVSMLLNQGRHPTSNESVIPAHVVDHVAQGLTVSAGKASYPELSPKVYGCGQWRYTYQGHEIVEHGGHNPGFLTQISRFPNDNLGLVLLSNDEDAYGLYDAVKWRIVEDVLQLPHIDWDSRFRKENADSVTEAKRKAVSRPQTPQPPSSPFTDMQGTFSHPTYGSFSPCYVAHPSTRRCQSLLAHPVSQRLLSDINDNVPTLLVPFKRTFTTHILLRHFDGNFFNASMIWSNYDVRKAEGHAGAEGHLLVGMDERFEVEWVEDSVGLGWAFKGNFWGKQGDDAQSPGGVGRSSAEVWFDLVDNL